MGSVDFYGSVYMFHCWVGISRECGTIRVDRLNAYAYMSLWLKAEKYTVDQINLIPTGGGGMHYRFSWLSSCVLFDFFLSHTNLSLIVLLGLRRYPTALANHSLCSPPPTNRKYHPVNLAKRQKRVVRRVLSITGCGAITLVCLDFGKCQ